MHSKLFALASLLFYSSAFAAIWESGGTPANVQSIHDTKAADGDTITIPSGTFTWRSRVTITKGVTLKGQGIGATIVKDAMASGTLVSITTKANKFTRLTGIEFQDGGRTTTALAPGGVVHVDGSNIDGSSFRMDHCKQNDLKGSFVFNTVIGVLDHNTIIFTRKCHVSWCMYGNKWDGDTAKQGDKSWAAPTNFGSSQWTFVEDNNFAFQHTAPEVHYAIDGFAGCRYVARHNVCTNALFGFHGTESRRRSGRAVEIYENKFTGNLGNSWGSIRGGLVVAHHNTISGYGASPNYGLSGYRSTNSFGAFGGADGVNQWDVNDPTVYFEGTVQTSTAGSRTVTINGSPNWTPNDKWKTYTIRRTTNLGGLGGPAHGWIIRSTGNTITTGPGMSPPGLQFTAGDTVQIRKVLYLMDAPGRARGNLITGLSTPALPAGWNDQVTEGCYQWENGAGHFGFTPGTRSGVNGFDNTPMPGYRPYTYPHPLVSGQPQPTARPTATVAPSPTPPEPTPEPTPPDETPTPPPEQTPTPTPEESQPSLAHAHASLSRADPTQMKS